MNCWTFSSCLSLGCWFFLKLWIIYLQTIIPCLILHNQYFMHSWNHYKKKQNKNKNRFILISKLYIYIYIYNQTSLNEKMPPKYTLFTHTHTHTHIYIYMHIYKTSQIVANMACIEDLFFQSNFCFEPSFLIDDFQDFIAFAIFFIAKIITLLEKNIRPLSKMKKKILFAIFKLWKSDTWKIWLRDI